MFNPKGDRGDSKITKNIVRGIYNNAYPYVITIGHRNVN